MSTSFSNRIAVVTGGASGLGLATVERLLAGNARVAIWDNDFKGLEALRPRLTESSVTFHHCDVIRLSSVEAAVQETIAAHHRVDILVNNAGIAGSPAPLWSGPVEDWKRVIEINLIGQYHCCRAIVPHMIANGYGRIVNVASVAGKEGNPMMSAYSASKGAVIAMTKSLARELASYGILVNAIAPGMFRSPLVESVPEEVNLRLAAQIPLGRIGEPSEIARMIAFLASDETTFSTGAVFDASGGRATS